MTLAFPLPVFFRLIKSGAKTTDLAAIDLKTLARDHVCLNGSRYLKLDRRVASTCSLLNFTKHWKFVVKYSFLTRNGKGIKYWTCVSMRSWPARRSSTILIQYWLFKDRQHSTSPRPYWVSTVRFCLYRLPGYYRRKLKQKVNMSLTIGYDISRSLLKAICQ